MQEEEKYDLIISNPPFFSENYKTGNENRDQARFADALPLTELIEGASLLLSKMDILILSFPFLKKRQRLKAGKYNLFPNKITRVKGTESSIKRSLISFSFEKRKP